MSEMTAAEAAEVLEVSQRQVARLASKEVLTVSRVVGRTLLLDSASVHRLAQRARRNGRPWSAATAWAALALLSGKQADWMDAARLSRLRHRLRGINASDLVWLSRRRATIHQMRGWDAVTGLVPTGVSALRDPENAALFGLSATDRGSDGYVAASAFPELVTGSGLYDDIEGDVVVRVVPDDAGYRLEQSLVAAVAVDLAEALDTREAAAGERILTELLTEFRAGDGHRNRTRR
ncbi:DNA-binding protein [[Mycobacterium] wendilense]|uniref:DNA-binding protein n=1 Tax=[Mycobacterium] wendilense TaxID=3064284 RepID=A0ABN9P3S9_9MYCO|nr:DNA-binding protein [Mycolicibacterium sp. MU0050]CAJ1583623.1 DNA-binding protein [Mycolicibacterium sp. MU0050]